MLLLNASIVVNDMMLVIVLCNNLPKDSIPFISKTPLYRSSESVEESKKGGWIITMEGKESFPWKNGYYKPSRMNNVVFSVYQDNVKTFLYGNLDYECASGKLKLGRFGEAHAKVKSYTGKNVYDVEILIDKWMDGGTWFGKGAVSEDGARLSFWTMSKELEYFDWVSKEDLLAFVDSLDPVSAPSNHYKLQPKFTNGKFLWISGAPGLGKSTSGPNPYIPPNVEEPSLATIKQNPLKGVPKERLNIVNNGFEEFIKMIGGKGHDDKTFEEFYSILCNDIKAEKKRIGGNWVVAGTVFTKALREHIKKELGPDLVFVLLNMTIDEQRKRVLARHGEGNVGWLINVFHLFEPATAEETNTISVNVTNDMSKEDVVKKILEQIEK